VLGLISRSVHGLEILSEHGWESSTTPLGTSLGLCIPSNLSKFFSFQPWKHEIPASIKLPDSQKTVLEPPPPEVVGEDETNRRILQLLVELGDMVLYKKAKPELLQLRHKKAAGFRQPALFRHVLSYLECHHFRLPDRHFVIELFDKSVLRQIVYGEDSGDEVDSSSSDEQRTERQRSISDPTVLDKVANSAAQKASL
jgi:rapamycin-insensitive companion of mTOR